MVETVRWILRVSWTQRVTGRVVPTLAILGALLAPPAAAESADTSHSQTQTISFAPTPEPSQTFQNSWWRDHFALRLRGLEFRDEFAFREQNLQFRLSGPVVKGSPGMRIEVRGFTWGEATGSISAYGSAERQGFKLKIDF